MSLPKFGEEVKKFGPGDVPFTFRQPTKHSSPKRKKSPKKKSPTQKEKLAELMKKLRQDPGVELPLPPLKRRRFSRKASKKPLRRSSKKRIMLLPRPRTNILKQNMTKTDKSKGLRYSQLTAAKRQNVLKRALAQLKKTRSKSDAFNFLIRHLNLIRILNKKNQKVFKKFSTDMKFIQKLKKQSIKK